jgi:hypothetical protein
LAEEPIFLEPFDGTRKQAVGQNGGGTTRGGISLEFFKVPVLNTDLTGENEILPVEPLTAGIKSGDVLSLVNPLSGDVFKVTANSDGELTGDTISIEGVDFGEVVFPAGTYVAYAIPDLVNKIGDGASGATSLAGLSDVDDSVASPSDGNILVYRSAGSDWVLEAKPAAGSNPAISDITDVVITSVADNEVLAYNSATSQWINQTAAEAGLAAASAAGALGCVGTVEPARFPKAICLPAYQDLITCPVVS